MSLWVLVRRLVTETKRELRVRGRLIAAVFAPARARTLATSAPPVDLIAGLNLAGEAAGVNAFDWDIDAGVFNHNRDVLSRVGGETAAARANLGELIEQSVYAEDRVRFRTEMVKALKGTAPLCIDYRVVHTGGAIRYVQLRGSVFRGPNGRANRVVGFTINMTQQHEASLRTDADAEKHRYLFERLSLATEAAGIGVWDWNLSTGKLGTDSNMASLFPDANFDGITRADEFVRKIIHPDDRERFLASMNAAVAYGGGDRISIQFRYLRNGGGVHHVELHCRIVRDANGRALRLLSVSWNITAKMEAQAQLERHSEAQRLLLERLNLATEVAALDVWDWDLVTDKIVADVVRSDAYGTEQVGRGNVRELMASFVHPEDVPGYVAALDRAIESGTSFFYRFRLLGRDGVQRFMQSNARVLRNEAGRALRMLGVTQDVTDEMHQLEELRRQANEERALRDRLNLATHTAGIAVWDNDVARGEFNCDEQFWAMFGLPPNNRFRVQEGIHPDVRESALKPLSQAFADPSRDEILSIRHRTSNPRPEPQYVQSHLRVFRGPDGRVARLLGVTWDVTAEEMRAEELRRKAEKERALLERLNVTTQSADISPWEIDLKTGQFTWHGYRLPVFGLDDVPLEKYMDALIQVVFEEDRHCLTDLPRDVVEGNTEAYQTEFRIRGKDGKIHRMRNKCRLTRNSKGMPRYALGITIDVTKEVEVAEQLRTQAELERALVNRLNVATQAAGISPWEFDLIADRFSWIGTPLPVLGLENSSPENYLADVSRMVMPEDRPILRQATVDALAKGLDVYSYVYRAKGIDGKIHHHKNFARVLRSTRGTPYRLVGVTWDVTEEVETTEQLKRQAQKERALTDRLTVATQSAGISTWEIDLATRKFLWVENPLRTTAEVHADGDDQENFAKRQLPEDRDNFFKAMVTAVKEGRDIISNRFRFYREDGSIGHVQSHAKLYLNEQRRATRALGVSWDVSKEVEAAEQLKTRAEQERKLIERLNIATSAANIASWEIDLDAGKFLWIENPLKSITYQDDDGRMEVAQFSERIVSEDRAHMPNAIDAALKEKSDRIEFRYRVIGNDGVSVHVQNFARLIVDDNGHALRVLGVSWDVTGEVDGKARLEQQAQKERELTERLSVATRSAGISSWEIDMATGKFLWVDNPHQATRGGAGSEKALTTFSQRMHPDDINVFRDAIRSAAKEGRDLMSYRYRYFTVDGSIVHIQSYAKLYFNEQRRATRVLGVSWDVTHEVEAAERLREAERRLERASISSSEGHWEADLAKDRLWFSASFQALLGYREGELQPRTDTLDSLIHDEDLAKCRAALRAHLDGNGPYDIEHRMRTASGDYRWYHTRGAAERDEDGKPILIAGSIHDVHQQKLVEDALQLAQRRFERAINGTQDGLWELDVATNEAWCSPRLALLLGYNVAELGTSNFLRSLIHRDDAAKLENVTRAHYRDNSPFDLEVRLRTRSSEYRWYRARATAERGPNGRALRLSGSLQDVSDARAAREELLRATEAAEAANRAKSAFLANMSHEIRTPMNGIVGMTGLILETDLNRTQREYADTIRGSADSLLTIINDILDFSKIEAGKLDLEYIDVDLRMLVEDIASMMAFHAANKGIELIVNVHPETPDRIKGDPQRLRQCLVNLVGNAIKFTKEGEIAIDVCALGRHEGRVLTHFEVRDTGIGIPQTTLKTLFQPFVQADSSTTRHFGGTGLGLSIVRRLVEMMGGQVGVVSELGKGSNFFFTLSLEPVEYETESKTTDAINDGRILVVDDNATNRRVLRLQLEHNGYRIITASSGADALAELHAAIARGQPIDLTITDYQMPDMDGAMLAARIAGEPTLANTRLIMLTSLDKQGDTQRLAALGFAAYLTKPIRRDELLTCVRRVFAGEARQWQMEIRPMITRNTLAQIDALQRFSGRVLLVEDNVVNQKVAGRVLERMGCTVTIADDGSSGVAAFTAERFDLVLMDLQMPIMDGMAAARKIRELEAMTPGRPRTPIVALTANAMKGDRELCEAAGMDDYLTKPLEVDRLRQTLARFGFASTDSLSTAFLSPQQSPTGIHAPPIDLARLNVLVDNDDEFMRELLMTFLVSGEQQIADLERATATFDRIAIARGAHKLKGGCGNIHAIALRDIATEMEASAATAERGELEKQCKRMRFEFERAQRFLSDPSVMPVPIRVAS